MPLARIVTNVSPLAVTYAVTMVQDATEQPAILCVMERSVQLSIAERTSASKVTRRKGSSVISTDVDGVKFFLIIHSLTLLASCRYIFTINILC